ncbi:hypothetical protein [Zavarzinella formosa]|uniref:hypothetical protein n=1 Tax=Zavarzinella formosa TaxID=360055 RepID=UPI0003194043|nr:hypothetical protein [Zavarzinella formosa]
MPDQWRHQTHVYVRGRVVYGCPGCGARRGIEFERNIRLQPGVDMTDDYVAKYALAGPAGVPPVSPCPRCGARLPRAIGQTRHWWDQWAAIFPPFVVAFASGAAYGVRQPWAYWLLIMIGPVIVTAQLWWFCRVGRRVPSSAGWRGPDGEPALADPAPSRRWGYAFAAVALLALLAPPVRRMVLQTPLNEECEYAVVSPGLKVRVYLANDLQAIKGEWGGTGRAVALNADELGIPPELPVETPTLTKTDEIYLKKDEGHKTPDTHVAITLPDDPALAGKTLRLRTDLTLTYPKSTERNFFEYHTANLSEERNLVLVTESERKTDLIVSVAGALTGLFFSFLGGALILWSDRRLRLSGAEPRVEIEEIEE